MHPRRFALTVGIVLLAMGVISVIPAFSGSAQDLPDLKLTTSYGLFLGFFPMNILNKLALIIFGLGGIAAASARFNSLPMSIHYSRILFYVMGVLAILGLIPQTDTLSGYWPLFNGEIALHALLCFLGAYFGYILTSKVPDSGPAITDFHSSMRGSR